MSKKKSNQRPIANKIENISVNENNQVVQPVKNLFDSVSNWQGIIFFGVLMLILTIVLYKDFISGKYLFVYKDIGSDAYNTHYPNYVHHINYLLKEGTPQWSFNQGLGQNLYPFWFEPISTFILYFFFQNDVPAGMVWIQIVFTLLAGGFFYGFLRALKLHFYPSLLGGLFYAFSGYMVLYGSWCVNIFPAEVMQMAFTLFAIEKYLSDKKWYYYPIVVALVGIHQPFDLYFVAILTLIYTLLRESANEVFDFKKWAINLLMFGLIGIVGLGLGSFLIWSNLQQMLDSPRGTGEFAYTNRLSSTPIFDLADSLQRSTNIMRTFSTNLQGSATTYRGWMNYMEAPVLYCGMLVLILVPQLFVFLSRQQRIFYGSVLVFFFFTLVFPFFRYAFWLFTGDYYRALGLIIVLLLIYYAMMALHKIYEGNKVNIWVLGGTVLMLLFLLLSVDAQAYNLVKSQRTTIILFIIANAVLVLGFNSKALRIPVLFMLLGLSCAELYSFSTKPIYERDYAKKADIYESVGYNDATIDALKYISDKDKGFYRVEKDYLSGLAIHGSFNDAKIQGYKGTRSYHSFHNINYIRFMKNINELPMAGENGTRWVNGLMGAPFAMKLCGVKYILSRNPNVSIYRGQDIDSVGMVKDVKILRVNRTLPLGVTYDKFMTEENFLKMGKEGKHRGFLQVAVVNKDLVGSLNGLSEIKTIDSTRAMTFDTLTSWTNNLKKDTLQIESYNSNNIKGKINLTQKKIMFFSIPYDKGWNLKVDGKDTKIEVLFTGLMGTVIEKGQHEIELTFEDPHKSTGTLISLLSLGIFVCAIFLLPKLKKKSNKIEPIS
ncbi:MAG: YfhO family protein [Spirosomataceae bacterium]